MSYKSSDSDKSLTPMPHFSDMSRGKCCALTRFLPEGTLVDMDQHLREGVLLLILVSCSNAIGQTSNQNLGDSGNRFLEICSIIDKPMAEWKVLDFESASGCTGYMMGFHDGIKAATATIQHFNPNINLKGSLEDLEICVPDEVDHNQLIRLALKYIREHPEDAHLPTPVLITMAELKAFPCGTTKK